MNAQDLRKLLEKANDKLNIFSNPEILDQYNFSIKEFCDLIIDFLDDTEKLKLLNYPHFKGFEYYIITCISDKNIQLQMLYNDNIVSTFTSDLIADIISSLSDNSKRKILHDQIFIKKHKFTIDDLFYIISSLSNNIKAEILTDKNLISNNLHLPDSLIAKITEDLSNEDVKNKIIEIYRIRRRFNY